jgi:hypothetical protein
MAAVAIHLADTSALARLSGPEVAAALGPLIEAGLVARCHPRSPGVCAVRILFLLQRRAPDVTLVKI